MSFLFPPQEGKGGEGKRMETEVELLFLLTIKPWWILFPGARKPLQNLWYFCYQVEQQQEKKKIVAKYWEIEITIPRIGERFHYSFS